LFMARFSRMVCFIKLKTIFEKINEYFFNDRFFINFFKY